jgi:uncharacterized protein
MEIQLSVSERIGRVSAILVCPPDPWLLYIVAHGAGAGMRHPFLESIATTLAERGVATLRYHFPYMEAGRKRPDPPRVLEETVRAAVNQGRELVPGMKVIAGGKSLGGRMTSSAAADGFLPGVSGLAFLGFPLHPPGQPGTSRADHLERVDIPMLFLQGTRDDFARLDLITDVCEELGPNATLHAVDEADHSFGVPKRSGRSRADILQDLAGTIAEWARSHVLGPVSA